MATDLSKSTLFHSDQNLCYAESLLPSQVRARIEVAVLNFLRDLSSPSPIVPDIPLVSRRSSNCRFRQGLLSDVSSVFLGPSSSARSLTKPSDTRAFIRVWKVMEVCFQLVSQEKKVTQRELFYKLLCDSPAYFTSQVLVNRTVQDVVSLLRCSRNSLGIMASTRGTMIGRIIVEVPGQNIVDCSTIGTAGFAITGDLSILDSMVFQSDARYIIIVEKDAIFQRLAEDRIFLQIPSILITAKGYPDLATRFLLHRLSCNFPELPIIALVDWNPAGIAILCIYKYGSITMGLESYRYACNVKWLGLRGHDLHKIPSESFTQLQPRDLQTAKGLMSSKMFPEIYKDEVARMVEKGLRVDIEALYYHGFDFLGKYIASKIVQGDYI